MEPARTKTPFLALLALATAVLVVHARSHLPFLSDDALISLRYAERLLDGAGLTWTAGPRVEGYSNLLWTLLVAALGAAGMDLIEAARLLGVACMALVLVALTARTAARAPFREAWLPLTVGLLFFGLASPTAVWAVGGLEQPLVAALLALTVAVTLPLLEHTRWSPRALGVLSVGLGLLCLTRPDGPLFAVVTAVALATRRWRDDRAAALRTLAVVLAGPIACYGGQLLFRVLYYGELVPNTALVKVHPSIHHLLRGSKYVLAGVRALAPLSLLAFAALLALLAHRPSRAKAAFLLAITLTWLAYVAAVGGDIFPAYRHFVPALVPLAFALSEATMLAVAVLRRCRPGLRLALPVAAAALLLAFAHRQRSDAATVRAREERWEWTGKKLALVLRTAFARQQPVVAVTAAGCLPYWSGLPALDLLGLNDAYLPRHPPPTIGRGFLGHELGDIDYLLRQAPDLIIFHTGQLPMLAYKALPQRPAFVERYLPISISLGEAEDPALVYVRRDSPAIGVRDSGAEVRLPGFLFRGPDSVARLARSGALAAVVPPGARLELSLPARTAAGWEALAITTGAGRVDVELAQQGSSLVVAVRNLGDAPLELEGVTLRRR